MIHKAHCNGKHYYRKSVMENTLQDNFMFSWASDYFKILDGNRVKLTEDESVVRAFTKNEWELFLYINNFELIDFINRKSYAFDTYVVLAKKR